jgi:hypothetical protein
MKPGTSILLLSTAMIGFGSQAALAESGQNKQTRVFAGDCLYRAAPPVDEGALTKVLDAATGGLISGTLGRIGKALRAAGEEDADVIVGRYPAEFEPGVPAKCVFIAKGKWTSTDKNVWKFRNSDGDKEKDLRIADRRLVDPDFFLEVAIERSGGGNALRAVPNYFHYVRLIEDKMKSNKSASRGIVFEIAVHPPAVGPKGKGAVGASLVLGTMETGYAYNLRAGTRAKIASDGQVDWKMADDGYLPLEYTSTWFPTFAPAAVIATNSKKKNTGVANGGAAGGDQAIAPTANAKKQQLPRTVTVTFTETRAPRKVLLFLADVFEASKDEMQKAAEIALIDSRKTEAELAAGKASTALMTDYVTRQAAAEVAILTYCNAANDADRIAKSSAANVAQRAANLVALAASQPQPYTSFVETSSDHPGDSGFCG